METLKDTETVPIFYDDCGGIFDGPETMTKWSQIYRYNYAMYMIMVIINCMGICCVPCAPGLIFTGCCFCMTGIPMLTAIILTGVRFYSDEGTQCSQNESIYD